MGSQTLFLIGAGFNCDAWCQFDGTTYTYPLVDDLLRLCFGLDQMPIGMSVEDLFQKAIDDNNDKPNQELTDMLLEADHYIVGALRKGRNVYRLFLEHFSKSEFLTFNYDGLLEALLIDLGRWCPQDGFGPSDWISRSECIGIKPAERGSSSTTRVLHLHGSLYVYGSERTVEGNVLFVRPSPEFRWHPHSNSALFSRYPETTSYDLQYDGGPANRIIAPIPDKSEGLEGVFMKAVNEKAKETARLANHIVAIGYSFNVHDRKSYEPILKALATRIRLTIISPDAEQSAERLRTEFKNLEVVARASTFKQWADTSFPL